MGLSVTFISGLRRSGKSALITTMIERLWQCHPHYIRVARKGSDKSPPRTPPPNTKKDRPVASARWIIHDDRDVFELLPEAVAAIQRTDPDGTIVIEADAEPTLRNAYPYDHRVFVMPMPNCVREIFRDSAQAAEELKRTLDDTAAFASEMFGLLVDPNDDDLSEERPDLTPSHMRGFLYSPLGDELATRIQLQPAYHGLAESDVVLVNSKAGEAGPETAACIRRIEQLLERFRHAGGRSGQLIRCDPAAGSGRAFRKLLTALRPMCTD